MSSEPLEQPLAAGTIRLEPIAEGHRAALKAACAEDREIWAIYSIDWGPGGFDANFDRLLANPQRIGFAIHDGDRLVGMTAWIGLNRDRQTVELGNTYLVPAVRGTGFNGRVKRLLLDHAFANGIRRVEFTVDVRNARSQAAVAKIGGVKEGVLRQHIVTWTGHVRDSALFSILRDEWTQRESQAFSAA